MSEATIALVDQVLETEMNPSAITHIKDLLIDHAIRRTFITYEEIVSITREPMVFVKTGAACISADTWHTHGCLLSAIIVDHESPLEMSQGFTGLARQLGALQDDVDPRQFWRGEVHKVFETFSGKELNPQPTMLGTLAINGRSLPLWSVTVVRSQGPDLITFTIGDEQDPMVLRSAVPQGTGPEVMRETLGFDITQINYSEE